MGLLDWLTSSNDTATKTAYGVKIHGPKRRDHYGWCHGCGESWGKTDHTNIYYTEHSAAFPLCTECFQEKPTEDVVSYFKHLYTGSGQLCWGRKPNEEHFETFRENVERRKAD